MSVSATPRTPDNSIGFLRLALASAVLWGHAWHFAGRTAEEPVARWLFGGGEAVATFAVKGFFALSGFLVLQSEQRLASTRRFLWHRLLRIYPGFWACLVVTALIFPALVWNLRSESVPAWSSAVGYIRRNWLLIREQITIENLLRAPEPFNDLNGSLWTLPYEIGCYAVLAFLGWLGLMRRQSAASWLVGGSLLALYLADMLHPASAWFFKTEGRCLGAYFLCGALAANFPEEQLRRLIDWRGLTLAAVVFLAACRLGGLPLVAPFAITALVLGLAWVLPLRDFETRVGGDYSYGIYIYAYPVQQVLLSAGLLSLGMGIYLASIALITAALAVASWHLVEKRALRWKSLGLPPRVAPVAAAAPAPI